MDLIVIIGQFEIHPDDAAAAAELMLVMMTKTREEQGCCHYAYSRDLSNSNRFELSELWEDENALAAHFRIDHMAEYRAGMSRLRVLSRTVKRYQVTNVTEL